MLGGICSLRIDQREYLVLVEDFDLEKKEA